MGTGEEKKLPRGFPLLFQSKLVKYFSRQLSCKRKVALQERNAKLEGFPQLLHWFRIVDIRKEVMEVRRGHRARAREVCCGILQQSLARGQCFPGWKVSWSNIFGPRDTCSKLGLVVENGVGRQGDQFFSLHGKVLGGRCWLGPPRGCPLKLGTSHCCFW